MSETFYRDLPAVSSFAEATNAGTFSAVPGDWWVAVTDIVASTAAIEAGRYRDVNTVGALGLAALQAALPDVLFPFAFGGDGSVALLPPQAKDAAVAALAGLPSLAQRRFGLALRVGLVPMQTLLDKGHSIAVAKVRLEHGYPLALFRGSGTQHAEALLKQGAALPVAADGAAPPDLSQLMCLWQPIASRRGTVLSILVDADPQTQRAVLSALSATLDHQLSRADPIHIDAMEFTPLRTLLAQERRYQDALGPYLQRVLVAVVMWLLCGTRLHRIWPALRTYLAEFHADSDYRKLGPMLSMVLDCTLDEATAIEACLAGFQAEQGIDYGVHRSGHCLMTCFVPSPDPGRHMALVDGGDGGYALAARALKARRDARLLAAGQA